MRFGLFFLAEWGNLWVMSALLTTLFLGGWQVPWVSMATLHGWELAGTVHEHWYYFWSTVFFVAKTMSLVFVVVWIRWTLPRIRVDQMMSLCWKYLVPAGMVIVVLTALSAWHPPRPVLRGRGVAAVRHLHSQGVCQHPHRG
jgi:NADH-quinone oxidoreductase subunit H